MGGREGKRGKGRGGWERARKGRKKGVGRKDRKRREGERKGKRQEAAENCIF